MKALGRICVVFLFILAAGQASAKGTKCTLPWCNYNNDRLPYVVYGKQCDAIVKRGGECVVAAEKNGCVVMKKGRSQFTVCP